eukprot:jgi/Psemu1/14397/gm1.14397_g
MKAYRISTLLKLALLLASDAHTAMLLVSSYTFDPLNNSWKPSARQNRQRRNHQSSPGGSSAFSENSYAPAEPRPRPSPAVQPNVQPTYSEEDIVRHHYTAFGLGANAGQQANDPTFVSKASLVEIQYNKKTGEVSLLDEAGVVTPEEYKRIVNAVKYEHEGGADGSDGVAAPEQELDPQDREEGVVVGTTLYIDPEDLDPTEIIDIEDDCEDSKSPRQEAPIPQYEQRLKDYPTPQLQDQSRPSTECHHSESVSSSTATKTGAAHTAHATHAEAFNSYTIPQPQPQPAATATATATATGGYTNVQQPQQYQDYQYAQQQQVQTATAVAEPAVGQGYQYAQQQVQTATAVPTEPTVEQYYQQQNQQLTGYSYDYQAYYEPTMVTEQLTSDQGVEETFFDDGTYRKSRGFGFAHRRESFTGTEYEC